MKIVHISDSHGRHRNLTEAIEAIERIDVLIHSGDFSDYGIKEETEFFLEWFKSMPAKHKILIAGNHDDTFFHSSNVSKEFDLTGIDYLQDELIEIDGVTFYGSPWTPSPFGGSFTFYPGEGETIWQKIPDDVDVLITHGPKFKTLDLVEKYDRTQRLGCPSLAERIDQLDNLKAHLFGHIHEAKGIMTDNGIQYSNSATGLHVLELDEVGSE
ncbi:MAG: metallophosphoesterase [Hydrogenovibrio crunogenus]|uniref:3',5'-cyclic adenosine monophosphate phosphodiesterase CpdA n=1 Tax=Hydrogenovibrio crunogenus TaxID=39765 RepID=A0A4P7P0J2_9GAMM|nr:metallophosphatase domain-containing protein [Hydrogenovibrio crunogenus]MBD3612813.1 metallophosphoesterase [Hydrogenovibrio crunogenus]QBZ82752.1 3',5'-cyclic adenosine monophosphate phosphodiesterase CpdA [Hydrogenovibrio crunogenus]